MKQGPFCKTLHPTRYQFLIFTRQDFTGWWSINVGYKSTNYLLQVNVPTGGGGDEVTKDSP
jgi:hypothetical protein